MAGFNRGRTKPIASVLALVLLFTGCSDNAPSGADAKPEITVYSSRKEHLVKPLFDFYTEKTGISIRYITDSAGPLIARLAAEGANTPADMLMTVDAGNLWQAAEKGLLQGLNSPTLASNIPSHLRSEAQDWFGLSIRARTMVYATDRVTLDELSTYEDLAAEKWRGRLCLRTSKKVYNQSLIATMISALGEEQAETVVAGWVANLATDPFSSDTTMMEAIAAGQCDVGIANSYYFGRMKKADPELSLALFWPNQEDRGVHINISGAGITRHAKQAAEAQALLEWLSSPEAQGQFAELNQEFPANPLVKPSAEAAAWGDFKADNMNVEVAGRLQADAVRLMDRADYR
jgi:iron(III) transport system substrate-binding protein